MEVTGQHILYQGQIRAEGSDIQEKAKQWKFYDAMSFIRPYLTKCEYVSK